MANVLPTEKRAMILSMLVEGSSMRSISRVVGCSINTITKLLVSAGEACLDFHDENVRNLNSKRIECDEIWSFCYAKQKNADGADMPDFAGDVWTWTSIDADSKLICNWFVGGRDAEFANHFMHDLASRLANRVQMTTDGHKAYLSAIDGAFGNDIDYAQLVKLYGNQPQGKTARYSPAECTGIKKKVQTGAPDKSKISTSYVERQNLTMRMSMRRFTRLTNAFSKKFDNHCHALALYFVFYNFCRKHKTLGTTPAVAAGVTDQQRDMAWIVGLIDAANPAPTKRGPYKKKEISN
ncbi:DDE-type integrase/transposase/recombinase [Henriciella litoralis]|uniref:DDE-type integrase/transposase/recombinase n=1 Tax=Henriciella litoralis TaxID=568102 RepID=UPI0009FC5F85|nr:DDE-type integrase/transposase/recombinase [Henriciella litoralis]